MKNGSERYFHVTSLCGYRECESKGLQVLIPVTEGGLDEGKGRRDED